MASEMLSAAFAKMTCRHRALVLEVVVIAQSKSDVVGQRLEAATAVSRRVFV